MMVKSLNQTFVLGLGGSVFAPNGGEAKGIKIEYLNKFENFLRKQIAKNRRFFIVTGGGYTAREYRDAAAKAVGPAKINNEDLDWLGVHASRLNAHLLRTIFKDVAYPRFIKHYDMVDKNALDYKVVVGGGWKPGWSTDYCSVMIAQDYGVDRVINMTNVDYVYDKDPNRFKEAVPYKKLSWDEVLKIVGSEWKPGMNTPFDPVASRLAKKIGLKVIVCNGHDFENLGRILEGKKFEGTVIE